MAKLAANPKSANSDKEIWELSKSFMRQIKLPYVPLANLKDQESFDDGPSELEQRLDYVGDNFGIDVDDPKTRDREIEASWKAKAILGALKKPQFCMSDALEVYFKQRAPDLDDMSPRQAKRYRLDKENAIKALLTVLGEDIFKRYGTDNGPTNASAILMKHLRDAGIIDKKKAIHSLRHTIKQALRDVGCPKDVSDAIQGHSSSDASASYGSGHSLEVMAKWLKKAHAAIGLR